MSSKGGIAKGYKADYQIIDVGEFLRFPDGSKLRQGATAQTINQSAGGSLAFGNPFDVGNVRLYFANQTLYVAIKDLGAPPQSDANLIGFRIMMCMN